MVRAKAKFERRRITRRKAQRFYSHLYVHYKKANEPGRWRSVAYKDISGIGIGLLTNEPLRINEKLDLAIYIMNDRRPCYVTARVIWCRREKKGVFKVGLEFEKTQSNARLVEMLCEKMVELSLDRRAKV